MMTENITDPKLNWFNRILKTKEEQLAVIVGIITSLTFIIKQVGGLNSVSQEDLLISIDILNLLILLIGLMVIKKVSLDIKDREFQKLVTLLGLKSQAEGEGIQLRVNQLTNQLVHCIRWFIIILGIFYLLQFFVDTTQKPFEELKNTINAYTRLLDLLNQRSSHEIDVAGYLTLEIFTNAANIFSASYLFLAFQVLFLVTLEDDNKTWKLKNYVPISMAIFVTVSNIVFIITGFYEVPLSSISHITRLLGGIYNGMAMLLLFSRFISMEYFFQNSQQNWQRNFYFYGTTIVLPLYVVAQPLYGLFNAVEIGESAVLFKTIVFLICFWGKLVFLLFVYTMLNKKWIHAYLFMVLSQKDTMKEISTNLNDIDDL